MPNPRGQRSVAQTETRSPSAISNAAVRSIGDEPPTSMRARPVIRASTPPAVSDSTSMTIDRRPIASMASAAATPRKSAGRSAVSLAPAQSRSGTVS